MKFPRISLLISALVLTACGSDGGSGSNTSGGGSTAVDSNGACTATYITAWNDVKYKADSAARVVESNLYSTSEKLARVRELQNSCSALRNLGSVSCLAEVGGQNKSISYNDRKEVCDIADSIVRKLNNSGGVQPVPVDRDRQEREERERRDNERRERERRSSDNRQLEDLRQIEFSVANAWKVERLRNNDKLVAVGGEIGTMESYARQIVDGAAVCLLRGSAALDETYGKITDGKTLEIGERQESIVSERRALTVTFKNASLSLICIKKSTSPFTMGEVKDALEGVLSIRDLGF